MSRELPAAPNLEHLRKQAKRRLAEMQRENPDAQLADAQHAIARDYGFASWPRLRAHLESLPPAPTPSATSPFVGTWIANVAKSRQHPLNPFRSATMHFEVTGDAVTITDFVVDATGHAERRATSINVDGVERASDGGRGYTYAASWRGPRALETVGRKDDDVIGRGTYEVAADGQTMTISNDDQLLVLERLE